MSGEVVENANTEHCEAPSPEAADLDRPMDSDAINKLSNSLLLLHVNDLQGVAEPLDELRRHQESLIEALVNENNRFQTAKATTSLAEMFNKVNHYHNKLVSIKKEMVSLHEKTTKLKKRAVRLQQVKEKQNPARF